MEITIKEVPTECKDEVIRMARVAVLRHKEKELEKVEANMSTFDKANNYTKTP